MMRLGMFDEMESQPLVTTVGAADVDSEATRALAQTAAEESFVLLKNVESFLPLDGKEGRFSALRSEDETKGEGTGTRAAGAIAGGAIAGAKFAFIGPLANATQDLLSAPQYHGQNTLVNSHSPLQVAEARGWDVSSRYAKGVNICDWVPAGYPNQPW
jgi:beta-glucosidase-like glycosyl hydrolase